MEIDLARILFYHGVLDSSYTLSIALRESQSDRFVTTGWTEVPKFGELRGGASRGGSCRKDGKGKRGEAGNEGSK